MRDEDMFKSRRVTLKPQVILDRTVDGIGRLAVHEAESLDGHWLALRERWAVARKARGVGELLRDQIDLLPETVSRVRHDHRVRKTLWRDLVSVPAEDSRQA